jgi:hypothetical protein
MVQLLSVENNRVLLKKLKIKQPYDPLISLLGIYPKDLKKSQRDLCIFIHSSVMHNR